MKIGIFPIIIFGAQKKWSITGDSERSSFLTSGGDFRDSGVPGQISQIPGISGGGGGSGNAYIDHFLIPGLFLSPAGGWRVVFRICPVPEISLHGLTLGFRKYDVPFGLMGTLLNHMLRWRVIFIDFNVHCGVFRGGRVFLCLEAKKCGN